MAAARWDNDDVTTSPRRLPTQEDVARESGFSRTLVSRALRGGGRVSEDARRKILATAATLGYRPNAVAAGLASKSSSVVGLILPDARNPFFDALCDELRRELDSAGQMLMVTFSGPDAGAALHQAEQFMALRVTGLMMVSPWLSPGQLRGLGEQVPLCLLGHLPVGGQVDAVRLDEQRAAVVVADELARRRVQRMVHVAPAELDPTGRERRDALAEAARGAGLEWESVESDDAGTVVRELLQGTGERLGLVMHNDMLGIDAVAAARAVGLRVGADVPVISYDNTHLARRPEFGLSSVDQSPRSMAAVAVRMLLDRAAGGSGTGRTETVAPDLVVRASLGRL